MDADEIERIINEELKKMVLSEEDLDDEEEDLFLHLPEDDSNSETDDIPESMLTYFEAAKDRMSVFEKLLKEEKEENNEASRSGTCVATCESEDLLKDLAVSDGDNSIALKERIISELEEQLARPTALEHQMAVEDSAVPQNETAVGESDEYLESEQRLELELEELERRLKEEEKKKREAHEAERRQHLLREEQEEDRKRLSHEQFAKELRKIDEESQFQNTMAEEREEPIDGKMELELANQIEAIRRLEEEVKAERQTFEDAQEEQRRRQLEREQRAATMIQAAVRSFLTRRWTKLALDQRREEERRKEEQRRMDKERKEREERLRQEREEEEKRREEKEARQRAEQERRRAAYEKAKHEERQRLEREKKLEEEKRTKEEEERKKREEEDRERKRKEAVERKRQEKEEEERKQKMEKERQQKLEEEKRRKEEEAMRRQEEEQKRKEEDKHKRRAAEEHRKREEDEKKRIEWEKKKKLAEEMRRKEEERKWEEERIVKAEEEKRTKSVEGSRSLQEKNEEEREGRKTQSTQETAPHETDITDSKPVEQRTAASSDDQPKANSPQLIYGSTLEPSRTDQRRTSSYLDRTSPMGSGHTEEAVDAGSVCLPDCTEQKRLAWMLNCIPWSKLTVQNRRKGPPGQQAKRRGPRRPAQPSLPPLSVDAVLQSGARSSLTQVTTVILEDLPGCSVSTLSACGLLQSLSLRRCGLTTLEGLSSCTQLRHIDVQENSIMCVDCGDLAQLQVLRLGRNQLTSIHGLEGAADLLELQLSHNRISRLGGLEALKKLQSLWIDHNQLTSTRGLTEAFTLQHLDLSHNHVTRAEGLDNCALLRTLRLAGNTLTEAPSLRNHVLLGELSLEDNSISCLEGLASCWLPLLHSLSVAQNSLTQLPPLPDFISLNTLDVSHNCLSELQSVCESVKQCSHLQQLNLAGNPLQQETSWRSSLLAAVPGLLLVDGEKTGACLACPTSAPPEGSFQALCQAQRQQLFSLQITQQAEISSATSLLEAQLLFGCHSEALFRLAEEQRYAHEYGDTCITHGQPVPASPPLDAHSPVLCSPIDAAGEGEPATKPRVRIPSLSQQCQAPDVGDHQSSDLHDTNSACQSDQATASCGPDLVRQSLKTSLSLPYRSPGPRHAKLDLRSVAAVVIQKYWRGYQCRMRECLPERSVAHGRCSPSVMRKLGMALPKSSDRDYAATVIQAAWRGHALRSRLHRALAAAEEEHSGLGDEGFEEVDVDQFVFDEEAAERDWLMPGSDGISLPREPTEVAFSARTPLPKPTLPPAVHHKRNPPVLLWKPKQAWGGSEASSASEMGIPHGSPSSKSAASTISGGGISARSEKILEEWGITDSRTAYLMLKRAQRMKSKKHQQRKLQDPTMRLVIFRNHGAQQPVPAPVRGRAPLECRDRRKAAYAEEEEVEEEEEEPWERAGQRMAGRTYQWLHTQAVGLATSSHLDSGTPSTCASERFLPEINPDVLSGGRVQLVTVPGYRDGACAGPADLSNRETGIVRRHSVGHTRKEAPAPQRVTSAPAKKERISYRDKPVQLSGGWGGGKKRVRVCK